MAPHRSIPLDTAGHRLKKPVILVSRTAILVVALGGLGLLGWASAATWFIINRDEIAARALAREADMQFAYEARLAAMRAQLDQVASRQLINQDGVDSRLDQVMGRQAQIEARQAMLGDLMSAVAGPHGTDPATTAATSPSSRAASSAITAGPDSKLPPPIGLDKPRPAMDVPPLRGIDRSPKGASLFGPAGVAPILALPTRRRPGQALDQVMAALDTLEARQLDAVVAFRQDARRKADHLREVLGRTGLPHAVVARLQSSEGTADVGGPFIPAAGTNETDSSQPFSSLVGEARAAIGEAAGLGAALKRLPLARPIAGDLDTTSGFGYRLDPFTRAPALHSGVDFRGETGTAVKAAAPGTVVFADWSGGYGKMVEIDHGHGITTRYGHLSAIQVTEGMTVAEGDTIGKVGATGRATGPHLHYETRLDDTPLDPVRFIRAGSLLRSQ